MVIIPSPVTQLSPPPFLSSHYHHHHLHHHHHHHHLIVIIITIIIVVVTIIIVIIIIIIIVIIIVVVIVVFLIILPLSSRSSSTLYVMKITILIHNNYTAVQCIYLLEEWIFGWLQLRPSNTGNIFVQLMAQYCCIASWTSCCSYYQSVLNLPRNKFQCGKLQQYVAKNRPKFYFLQHIFAICNTEICCIAS